MAEGIGVAIAVVTLLFLVVGCVMIEFGGADRY